MKQTGHPTASMLSGEAHHEMFPAQHMQHGAKRHDALYYLCCVMMQLMLKLALPLV